MPRAASFSSRALFFTVLCAVLVVAPHLPFLRLPFFWDELGQFIPASLDLYRDGAWIPRTATPNAHPPGVMAYLAGVWSVAGYSIAATRLAMLALASALAIVFFLLAIELCGAVSGLPALAAVLTLCASPVFFSQAMMAQLDLPAALFTLLALWLFLRERMRWSAAACTVLVLVKETGVVVPLLFGFWLAVERRPRQAALFLLPLAALAAWFLALWRGTGHLFGDSEFTRYNIYYLLHPARAGLAFAKRLYHLFIENFHWIGTLAIAFAWKRRRDLYATRPWRLVAALAAVHVVLFSVLGGAMLERYLLPVVPLVYLAAITAFAVAPARWGIAAQSFLIAGLAASNFWNPPYPFPYENNLAWTDFVRLHRTAADYVATQYPDARIATAWPLSVALVRPDFGYVRRALAVEPLPDFGSTTVRRLDDSRFDVFILYSREWNPEWNPMRMPLLKALWTSLFGYDPPVAPTELKKRFGLRPIASWSRGGQWIEVWHRLPDTRLSASDTPGAAATHRSFIPNPVISLPEMTLSRAGAGRSAPRPR